MIDIASKKSILGMAAIVAAFAANMSAANSAPERIQKGNLILEAVPETPDALRRELLQYQNTRSASLSGFDADNDGIFVTTRFAETAQVHSIAAPGAARQQVTFFDEPVGSVSPSPTQAGRFLFTRDTGGDENFQVYVFDEGKGAARLISDGAGRKVAPVWSKNGTHIAWQKTMDGGTKGIVVAPVASPDDRRTIFTGEGWWGPADWSSDGEKIILFNYVSINESEIFILDVETGDTVQINPSEQKIAYGGALFSVDGKSVYFTADEEGEFLNLYRYDITTGEKTNLTTDIAWDVEDIAVAPDGRTYAFTVNDAARSALHIRRIQNDRAAAAPELPTGVIYSLAYSPDGKTLGFTLNASDSPGDVYSWPVNGRGELRRWTQSEVGGLNTERFVEPEFFDYPTFDGVDGVARRIPAYIYRPATEGPHPVIISIHGGPEGQARPYFSSTYQYWANALGAAVIRPNVRGSAGFGKNYLKLDNGMKREDSVKDIGALIDWIETQPDLNADKVVVYGGSYGGYMVLASMVHYDDRLAGGVNIVGISNFVTFLENTADYRRDLRRAEYGDERDPEMRAHLEKISPLNRADGISKPLFIIQGLNDPRVPASEADQILAAVRANGGEAWYMGATDEGHGFRKKTNRDAMTEAVALFLKALFEE
ncbi:MAG: alpha/beta fold hydrolase [Pseudomonadota bacterium]